MHRLALQRPEAREKPQTRWSASQQQRQSQDDEVRQWPGLVPTAGQRSGVVVLDVVIDQALELGGELVVGAAQVVTCSPSM